MTYMGNNLAFAGCIQELSDVEVAIVGRGVIDAPADEPWLLAEGKDVNGKEQGSFWADIAGALATAGCDLLTKGKKTLQCAAAGVVVATVVSKAPAPGSTPRPTGVFPY